MPKMRKCCIVSCGSNSRECPSMQFFKFPRPDNPLYKLWIQTCHASLSRILPFKNPVVCALHFQPHCIGGRRLTGNAVPSLKLEVSSSVKAFEQQVMVQEIEKSRKCAYINAVVYEWLTRANLNSQLRGSITQGMIKEKAETAKQLIVCESFMADNSWLNRFREAYLTGFAQKLASNQLKPMGPSLRISDIVKDLVDQFPATNAERINNLENVPDQYINYLKEYGDYEEQDDSNDQETTQAYSEYDDGFGQYSKFAVQSYYQQQQADQLHYQQQQNGYPHPGMNPMASYNDCNDHERQQHHNNYSLHIQRVDGDYGVHFAQCHAEPPVHMTNYQQQPLSRPPSHSPPQENGLVTIGKTFSYSPSTNAAKRPRSTGPDEGPFSKSSRTSPVVMQDSFVNLHPRSASKSPPTMLENRAETKYTFTNHNNVDNGSAGDGSNSDSPKSLNGLTTNGNTSPTPSQSTNTKDLETYAQALEYLKPLENFALFKENFRAIGLISQLEIILKKAKKVTINKSIPGE